jgi:hypothetical protein
LTPATWASIEVSEPMMVSAWPGMGFRLVSIADSEPLIVSM